MRKILTIRTPYVLYNHTMMDYRVKIIDSRSKEEIDNFILKAEKRSPLNSDYYTDHTIEIQALDTRGRKSKLIGDLEM
jgi:hypothetical protein